MTRPEVVGLLVLILLLLYALMYAGWRRRGRRASPSLPKPDAAYGPAEAGSTLETGRSVRPVPDEVTADGTYVSTTAADSRHERVVAAGLGVRAAATMTVADSGVAWTRQGAPDVRLDPGSVLGVGLERGMAGKFVGEARLVVVSWRDQDGEPYATGFLPRRRDDGPRLVAAVQRLAGADPHPDDNPHPAPDGDQ